jgi:hypothetical protein
MMTFQQPIELRYFKNKDTKQQADSEQAQSKNQWEPKLINLD